MKISKLAQGVKYKFEAPREARPPILPVWAFGLNRLQEDTFPAREAADTSLIAS